MEWVHCNNCCRQPRSGSNDFIMTSCGHIFCKKCENRDNIDSCLVCKLACRTTPLSGSLKPEIKMYFEDVETQLCSTLKVIRFQKNHRISLFKKQVRVVELYRSVKTENDLLRKKLLEAEKKIQHMEKQRERYLQRTPARNSGLPLHHSEHFSDPRTPAQDVFENTHAAFQHIQPHLRKYNNYRANNTQTPYNTSVPTPSSGFARSFHRQAAASSFPRPRESPVPVSRTQMKVMPTPPYNALKGMNIDELTRRNRRLP